MQRFKDILFATTLDADDSRSLERAVAIADQNQARLTVAAAFRAPDAAAGPLFRDLFPDAIEEAVAEEKRQQLEAMVSAFRERLEIQIKILPGIPFLEIIREVLRHGQDLVIKTAAGDDRLKAHLFGSDDMQLLRQCPCPVWMMKPGGEITYRNILAAFDFNTDPQNAATESTLNRQILEMAAALALAELSELHLAHAWEAVGENIMRSGRIPGIPKQQIEAHVETSRQWHTHKLNELLTAFTRDAGEKTANFLNPKQHVLKGSARERIPALAEEVQADLIVMGTVGRTGIPGFIIGNTAETILNRVNCSVLAIKPPGFKTPVIP